MKKNQINIDQFKNHMSQLEDFITEEYIINNKKIAVYYMKTLINESSLYNFVIRPIKLSELDQPLNEIELTKLVEVSKLSDLETKMFTGNVILECDNEFYYADCVNTNSRSITESTTEVVMYGSKDAFTEIMDVNLTLLRRRIPSSDLKIESTQIGKVSKTKVSVVYLESIIDQKLLKYVLDKLKKIETNSIFSAADISNFMDDNVHSLFPQFQQSDRPDTVAAAVSQGKVVIFVNNSPYALIAPVTFFDFFQSPEDYVNKWVIASLTRLLRYFAFFLSLIITPLYVAVTMYHYEVLPLPILDVIINERTHLPFNPFWEALIILLTLEIIKEASLRMPTKSGQSLGIVGGLVIGQAAVSANLASNILIIAAAISVLASSVVPNFIMSTSTRYLQIFLISLAAIEGITGIALGMIAIFIHLNGLTSLTRPFLTPLSPISLPDLKDTIVRLPGSIYKKIPKYLKKENQNEQ